MASVWGQLKRCKVSQVAVVYPVVIELTTAFGR